MVHGLHVSEEMFAAAIFDSILYIQLSSNICKYINIIYIYIYITYIKTIMFFIFKCICCIVFTCLKYVLYKYITI